MSVTPALKPTKNKLIHSQINVGVINGRMNNRECNPIPNAEDLPTPSLSINLYEKGSEEKIPMAKQKIAIPNSASLIPNFPLMNGI